MSAAKRKAALQTRMGFAPTAYTGSSASTSSNEKRRPPPMCEIGGAAWEKPAAKTAENEKEYITDVYDFQSEVSPVGSF